MRSLLKKILMGVLIAISLNLAAVLAVGACKVPADDVYDKTFCDCFLQESETVCLRDGRQYGISQAMCSQHFILSNMKHITKPSLFCKQYWFLLPEGVDNLECVADINYVKKHC